MTPAERQRLAQLEADRQRILSYGFCVNRCCWRDVDEYVRLRQLPGADEIGSEAAS